MDRLPRPCQDGQKGNPGSRASATRRGRGRRFPRTSCGTVIRRQMAPPRGDRLHRNDAVGFSIRRSIQLSSTGAHLESTHLHECFKICQLAAVTGDSRRQTKLMRGRCSEIHFKRLHYCSRRKFDRSTVSPLPPSRRSCASKSTCKTLPHRQYIYLPLQWHQARSPQS